MTDFTRPTTDVDLYLGDLVTFDAVVFAAIALVLLVTGLVSGIAGVTLFAGLTALVSVGLMVAHSARAMVTPTTQV
ncbi:hypothetical protein [Agilicoccus flavus]|uniref:hypothetical protein n=1 Tax=Agilicoccus flavus TaxID=2775968 RepID=UPI001CF65EFD|nr:hypothetical protein [Agilicoccus flavus]